MASPQAALEPGKLHAPTIDVAKADTWLPHRRACIKSNLEAARAPGRRSLLRNVVGDNGKSVVLSTRRARAAVAPMCNPFPAPSQRHAESTGLS